MGEAGCPSCLAHGQYGVHLGLLGVDEAGKGVGVPSRGWWTPYGCAREGKTGWRWETVP
jgi:hypothetical protein